MTASKLWTCFLSWPERPTVTKAEKIELTGELGQICYIAMRLPQILPTGRVREILKASLPETDLKDAPTNCSDAQARRLMVHYSFMVQSYVWGRAPSPDCAAALSGYADGCDSRSFGTSTASTIW